MARFAAGEVDVLVATSVIEVGIDVPNATVMVIEEADRYGISQLHQLRGRVGRGEHESYCLLFSGSQSELARRRLEAVEAERDGFRLAEVDLTLRGEGDLLGTKQSGLPEFKRCAPARGRGAARARAPGLDRAAARGPRAVAIPRTQCCGDALEGRFGALERRADRGVMRVRRGAVARDTALRAPPAHDPADRRPRARGGVQHPRARSTASRCSTCSPGRARSGSRRSHAAPPTAMFVDSSPPLRARCAENLERLGAEGGRVVSADALRVPAQRRRPASAGTWPSVTRLIDSRARLGEPLEPHARAGPRIREHVSCRESSPSTAARPGPADRRRAPLWRHADRRVRRPDRNLSVG